MPDEPSTPLITALDGEMLERLLEPAVSARLRDEIPALLLGVDDIRDRLRRTGLLEPTDSVLLVRVDGQDFVSAVFSPDLPTVPTTLRIGIGPLSEDASGSRTSAALSAVIDHVLATTTVLRVERVVPTTDALGRAACAAAGLSFEGVRHRAALSNGRVVDVAIFRADRASRPPRFRRPDIKRIAVVTGGGDAPGLNAVIRAVVKTACIEHSWEVLGILDGFEGLLPEPHVRTLTPEDVRGLLPRGGTVLGSTTRGRFNRRNGAAAIAVALDEAVTTLASLRVDALVAIGGDGTQTIASGLAERGIRVIGVPKTIDNDLEGTDRTFGFDTALELATDAIDRLHTTAESHGRVMVLEVMGRTTGWIALHAAVAGGADVALLPEIPFSYQRISDAIMNRERAGHRFSIVVAAEGAAPAGEEPPTTSTAEAIAAAIRRLTGKETRVAILGHLQRGGRPTAFDRVLATAFGAAAVRTIAAGATNRLVALIGSEITTVPLAEVAGRRRPVPLDSALLRTATELGIELGAEIRTDRGQ